MSFLHLSINSLDVCYLSYSVLFATAIRLLCKTWEYNDRVFGTLQARLSTLQSFS